MTTNKSEEETSKEIKSRDKNRFIFLRLESGVDKIFLNITFSTWLRIIEIVYYVTVTIGTCLTIIFYIHKNTRKGEHLYFKIKKSNK